jgi:hypothetical protein
MSMWTATSWRKYVLLAVKCSVLYLLYKLQTETIEYICQMFNAGTECLDMLNVKSVEGFIYILNRHNPIR